MPDNFPPPRCNACNCWHKSGVLLAVTPTPRHFFPIEEELELEGLAASLLAERMACTDLTSTTSYRSSTPLIFCTGLPSPLHDQACLLKVETPERYSPNTEEQLGSNPGVSMVFRRSVTKSHNPNACSAHVLQ
jgi:hypothetical protein